MLNGEPLSPGAAGQFLGARRHLTLVEQEEAFEVFLAKGPLTAAQETVARATWLGAMAFARVASFAGFDEAMATLRADPEEVAT